jgi:hypothetical protein
MNLSLLNTLKQKMYDAKDFSEVWDYFLTNFGEKPAFIKMGQAASDEFLESVLSTVGEQLFGMPVRISNMMLTRIKEYGFIHGTVLMEGKLTSALYFEDQHKGLLAILWSFSPPETKFVRFTGRALYDHLNRSMN